MTPRENASSEIQGDEQLRELLESIAQIRLLAAEEGSKNPAATIRKLHRMLTKVRALLGEVMAPVLHRFEGIRLTPAKTKEFASLVDETAKSLGLLFAVRTPDGEKLGARLRSGLTGPDRQPAYQFECVDEKGKRSMRAASRALPKLKLIPTPGWRRRLTREE